jgi:hypothetical protein
MTISGKVAMTRVVVRRALTLFLAGLVASTVGAVALQTSAFAASGWHSTCQTYDVCYYWADSPPYTQSSVGVWGAVSDVYNPWIGFQTPGSGQYQHVANNTGSFKNLDYQMSQTIWEDQGFAGRSNTMSAKGSLSGVFVTKNNNRAQS